MLDLAIQIASEVHNGQTDKSGEPYILHALAVMNRVEPSADGFMRDEILSVAVMHDVIEDFPKPEDNKTRWDGAHHLLDFIYANFPNRVQQALDALTRYTDEEYADYIERVARDWLARRVKIADLSHNMDTGRLPNRDITEKDYSRWDRYRRALVRLRRED